MNIKEMALHSLQRTITIRLRPKHEAVEKNLAFNSIGDMAKTYAAFFEEFQMSVAISFQMLERWGMTVEELDVLAAEQAPENKPYRLRKLRDVLLGFLTKEMMEEDPEIMGHVEHLEAEDKGIWILDFADETNYGAAAICYQEALEEISKALGDVWVIPSSVHEVLLIKDDDNTPEELENMIKEVNSGMLAPEEELSNSVYHYHVGDSQIETGYRWIGRREF